MLDPNILRIKVLEMVYEKQSGHIGGSFSIADGDDTIWLQITQVSPAGPWPYSYGIIGWRSEFGYELGTHKAFMDPAGEVNRIGVGCPARGRTGVLTYDPRSYNLAWIKAGTTLTLRFAAASGVSGGGGAAESLGGGSVAYGVIDGSWKYAASSGLLQLKL
jgi:hypothetical protein